MDPNTVVLDISSDEDVDWNDQGRGISDGGDDYNWLSELLDEVNKENYGDDSDEVVLVSESEKPVKKSKLKSCSVDLDDDCVVLENDPDEPAEVRNDNPSKGDDDSDDIVVVSEKGQVACRDYPHPRHLCIKFPFSTTPNQSHCNQCYCYVCDSLAPCVYWGNGSASTDHCHATDKDEFWTLERKNAKSVSKGVQPLSQLPPVELHRTAPALVQPQNHIPRAGFSHVHHTADNFQAPNIINQDRSHILASRNKLHQDLVYSQAMLRRSQQNLVNSQAMLRRHQNLNIGNRVNRPAFKRTGSVGVATTANQNLNGSYRGGYVNSIRQQHYHNNGMLSGPDKYLGSLEPSSVNTSVPYPPQHHQPLPPQPHFSNPSNPNFQYHANSNLSSENPLYQQPHLVPPSCIRPQLAFGQPSYTMPAQTSYHVPSQTRVDIPSVPVSDYTQNFPQGNEAQDSIMDSGFKDYGLSWPLGEDSATLQGTGAMNEPSLAVVPGGLADYRYDWFFDNPPVEPGFLDIPGPNGLNSHSSDSAFIDTGPIFDL